MRGQTQQQKIETESELNAFLDKRSYEVKDLREQLARHEAALEEARRTGEAATVAQSRRVLEGSKSPQPVRYKSSLRKRREPETRLR